MSADEPVNAISPGTVKHWKELLALFETVSSTMWETVGAGLTYVACR